jgi:hypothetical protein
VCEIRAVIVLHGEVGDPVVLPLGS